MRNILDLNSDGKTDAKDLQIWLAVILALSGVVLLFLGFFASPMGEIHASVITTAGELFTFCGVLLGIDHHYRHLLSKTLSEMKGREGNQEPENTKQ